MVHDPVMLGIMSQCFPRTEQLLSAAVYVRQLGGQSGPCLALQLHCPAPMSLPLSPRLSQPAGFLHCLCIGREERGRAGKQAVCYVKRDGSRPPWYKKQCNQPVSLHSRCLAGGSGQISLRETEPSHLCMLVCLCVCMSDCLPSD